MGLDGDTRKCQTIEAYDDCKTNLHIRKLRQECGCLPVSLRLSEKVTSYFGKNWQTVNIYLKFLFYQLFLLSI